MKRDTPLAQAHAIAQSQLDNDIQTQKQDEAVIASSDASIQAAEANVAALLNLGFTKVRSLVEGIAGIAELVRMQGSSGAHPVELHPSID